MFIFDNAYKTNIPVFMYKMVCLKINIKTRLIINLECLNKMSTSVFSYKVNYKFT